MRSAKAATGKTGRTVSGKRSQGATGSDFPSQRDSKTFPRRLSVCVEFHGAHDGRSAKADRPSAASPNLSQLSARGCTAVGSRPAPIEKNRVIRSRSAQPPQPRNGQTFTLPPSPGCGGHCRWIRWRHHVPGWAASPCRLHPDLAVSAHTALYSNQTQPIQRSNPAIHITQIDAAALRATAAWCARPVIAAHTDCACAHTHTYT